MRWRRRAKEVEAILYTGDNINEIIDFLKGSADVYYSDYEENYYVVDKSDRDDYETPVFDISPNDFVIKDGAKVDVKSKEEFLSEYERAQ